MPKDIAILGNTSSPSPYLGASTTPPVTYSSPLMKSHLILEGLASKLIDSLSVDSYLIPATILRGIPLISVSIFNWINAESKSSIILSLESISPAVIAPFASVNAVKARDLFIW